MLILRSSETDIILLLSGLYLTPQTWSLCSLNVCTHCLLLNSHTLTDLSELDDTKWVPSGAKSTLKTHDACPDKVPATFACCL